MNQQSRNVWRVFVLWAILAGVAVSAFAQDEEEEEDAVQPPAQVRVVFAESNFDGWVFQEQLEMAENRITLHSVTAVAARKRIDAQLKSTLDELVKNCDLTEAQRSSLALAARGDIKQFYDQVEVLRKKFLAVNGDQSAVNEMFTEIRPLQQQYKRGLFGAESLFAKRLRKTLTEEQQAKYQEMLLNRRRLFYLALITTSLPSVLNGIVREGEQCETLGEMLFDETAPPLVFGPYDQQVILLRLSQLPPEKLKAVLDKNQWRRLQPKLLQASGMEDSLAQHGVIEEPKANPVVVIRGVRTVVAPAETAQAQ